MQTQSYKTVTFKSLSNKKLATVREKITQMYKEGATAAEISKKLRISQRSAATAMGNLTRKA
jgi:DNA-binding CsgD family transcriptional regulator